LIRAQEKEERRTAKRVLVDPTAPVRKEEKTKLRSAVRKSGGRHKSDEELKEQPVFTYLFVGIGTEPPLHARSYTYNTHARMLFTQKH
jgi:hypothetical protein